MPLNLIQNDITKVKADAIVNIMNPTCLIGNGTESAIYKAAGRELLLGERRKIGNIEPGQSAYTDAFQLDARYIIHTMGPMRTDIEDKWSDVLHSCYRNSLNLAAQLECESIAFPLVATGVYDLSKADVLQIAQEEIKRFLMFSEMEVILTVSDRKDIELPTSLIDAVEKYMFEQLVFGGRKAGYGRLSYDETNCIYEDMPYGNIPGNGLFAGCVAESGITYGAKAEKDLDKILNNTEDTFKQRLFNLIDKSGMKDPEVYKKANINRRIVSNIRCNEKYKPTKRTVVALAIALQLDMPTMEDLLSRAGIAFSPCDRFDLIITFCVTKKMYDVFYINDLLFKYDQEPLGTCSEDREKVPDRKKENNRTVKRKLP